MDGQFGEGALDGALADVDDDARADALADDLTGTADPGGGRFGLGGHIRFGRGSKKVLELALREAIHQRSAEIRCEHLALALLRTDDEGVRLLLRMLGVDARAVREDLQTRRTA